MSTAFLQALRDARRKRIVLADLRRYWLDTNPEQLQHPDRDALLLTALQGLEAQGHLKLPAPASFERFGKPPMPKFITLTDAPAAGPAEDWSRIAWLPELGFWTDLTESELATARAINDWLIRRRGHCLRVPLRERSLEIFGDEKYLDTRTRNGALFAGRLPLAVIGAFQVPHPLPYRAADAPGRPVLVVENHHSYWSFAEWNLTARRYAAVIYGAGKAFCSGGPALLEAIRECRGEGAAYFGDLDPAGILIPVAFNQASEIPVHPAMEFYRLALDSSHRRRPVNRMAGDIEAVAGWLPELGGRMAALWEADEWIPQESVGAEVLAGKSVSEPEDG